MSSFNSTIKDCVMKNNTGSSIYCKQAKLNVDYTSVQYNFQNISVDGVAGLFAVDSLVYIKDTIIRYIHQNCVIIYHHFKCHANVVLALIKAG